MSPKTDIQVLLIEDDEIDAESVVRNLSKQTSNFAMTHVLCLSDALMLVKQNTYHIALLDLGLPDSTGLDGVIKLRKVAPHLPIMVLTGLDDQKRASEAVRAGAQDYLIKGRINQEVLVRAIGYAIDRQQIQNESVKNLKALKASESRFRRLYEAMFEGMIIHDGDTVIDANDQFASMFGYTVDSLVGLNIYTLLEPSAAQIVKDHITDRSEDLYETVGLRRNGEAFPIEIVARNMRFDGVDMRVAVVRDVTERRNSISQIRKLSQAVEQSANIVIVTDNQGIIEYVNPQFCLVTGYETTEVIGKKTNIVKSGDTDPNVYHELWQTISAGGTWQGELLNKTKEGEFFWVSTSISPVRDDSENITHYVAIQEDITQRKRTQEELAELNFTLEKRVKARTKELEDINHELETFSYSVSHDLQAPLRSILGFSQVLLEDHASELSEEGCDYLTRVCTASKGMSNLIADMLDYSRQTRGDLTCEDVNLSELAHCIAEQLYEEYKDREVVCKIDEGVIAFGDRRMLQSMLANLMSNAWKFTRDRKPAIVGFGQTTQGDANVYFVRDNGAGFDIKHAQTIFDPFRRLHKATEFEGTGIGLSIVQRIVRRHGGWVWAESQEGKGATFYFTLDMKGQDV